jgi:hypothetical protein
MRRLPRVILMAALVALAPALAGCENFDMDKLDVFGWNKKKPLPGKREPLFPNGVPGVTQGIPKQYLPGNQQQQDDAAITPLPGQPGQAPAAAPPQKQTATLTPAEKPKSKPKKTAERKTKKTVKRKPKPKPKETAARPAPSGGAAQQSPWTAPAKQPQQSLEPWPGQAQSNSPPWPSAPASNNSSQ